MIALCVDWVNTHFFWRQSCVLKMVLKLNKSINNVNKHINKHVTPPSFPRRPRPLSCWSFPVLLAAATGAEGGKMAAAESDRDPPSALCAEFLNFSAKDTASVSGSSSCNLRWSSPVRSLRHSELCYLLNAVFRGQSVRLLRARATANVNANANVSSGEWCVKHLDVGFKPDRNICCAADNPSSGLTHRLSVWPSLVRTVVPREAASERLFTVKHVFVCQHPSRAAAATRDAAPGRGCTLFTQKHSLTPETGSLVMTNMTSQVWQLSLHAPVRQVDPLTRRWKS